MLDVENRPPAFHDVAETERRHVGRVGEGPLLTLHAGPPSIAVVSPWAILISYPWLTVHATLCVTASTSPAADGWPLPLFFTPPNGKCTSAPMLGRFTYPMP